MKNPLENAVFSRGLDGDSSGIRTPDTLIKSQIKHIMNCAENAYTAVLLLVLA